jgi:hypothetical protein
MNNRAAETGDRGHETAGEQACPRFATAPEKSYRRFSPVSGIGHSGGGTGQTRFGRFHTGAGGVYPQAVKTAARMIPA